VSLRFITSEDGYNFSARSNFDNGLSFRIEREVPFGDPLSDWWTLVQRPYYIDGQENLGLNISLP